MLNIYLKNEQFTFNKIVNEAEIMFHNVHHEKMPKNLNYVFRESIGVYEGIYSAIQPETENIIVGGGNIF